jgi:hypothetical protein
MFPIAADEVTGVGEPSPEDDDRANAAHLGEI